MNQHSSINFNRSTAICDSAGSYPCDIKAVQRKSLKRPRCIPGNYNSFACTVIFPSKCQSVLIKKATNYLNFTHRETEAQSSERCIQGSQVAKLQRAGLLGPDLLTSPVLSLRASGLNPSRNGSDEDKTRQSITQPPCSASRIWQKGLGTEAEPLSWAPRGERPRCPKLTEGSRDRERRDGAGTSWQEKQLRPNLLQSLVLPPHPHLSQAWF